MSHGLSAKYSTESDSADCLEMLYYRYSMGNDGKQFISEYAAHNYVDYSFQKVTLSVSNVTS